MATTKHIEGSWYSPMMKRLNDNGLDVKNLRSFQYSTPLQNDERNKVLRQDLWHLHTQKTWLTPREPLPPKMANYKDHFVNFSEDGFILRLRYMDIYRPSVENQ